jgi:hypothetical protein
VLYSRPMPGEGGSGPTGSGLVTDPIYVAVGSADALHSGVWKAWTQGDEFYALEVASDMPSVMKLSVHSSGICRLANLERGMLEGHAWERDDDPRVIQRWRIAGVGSPDPAICFSLFVPTVFIPHRLGIPNGTPSRRLGKVIWVEPAPLMFATVVDFVRTTDPVQDPGPLLEDSAQLLGVMHLRSGSRISCFRREQALTLAGLTNWQREVTDAVFGVSSPSSDGDIFGVLQSPARFSFPVIREIALGLSNFRGPQPVNPPVS